MPSTPGSPAPLPTEAEILDRDLRRYHGTGDAARLCALHKRAAVLVSDPCEARFHLTHAWIYALVLGDREDVEGLERQLRAAGGL